MAYFYVDEIDSIAAEFGVPVQSQPCGREELTEHCGNRVRIGVSAGMWAPLHSAAATGRYPAIDGTLRVAVQRAR